MDKAITKQEILFVFTLAFVARYVFAYFSGMAFVDGPDWDRYDLQSDWILSGNYNLVMPSGVYIIAPFFNYLLAGMKYIFGTNYPPFQIALQTVLSSIAVVYLMKTAEIIFIDYWKSLLCGIAYAVYPMTLYYTQLLSQESIFQSFFVISIYYLSKFLNIRQKKDLVLFSVWFSAALLTKSHINFIWPFLLLGMLVTLDDKHKLFSEILIILGIIFITTLPYGLYNKYANDDYILSAGGFGGHFASANNEGNYKYTIDPPPLGSLEHNNLQSLNFKVFRRFDTVPYLQGAALSESQLAEVKAGIRVDEPISYKETQSILFNDGFQWIINNPNKFFELTFINIKNFLTPGVNIHHYPFNRWLFSFIIGLPIFILAYIEIIKRVVLDFKVHFPILAIFLGLLTTVAIFSSQARFRIVTIEPFYLMYACSLFVTIVTYVRRKVRNLNRYEY